MSAVERCRLLAEWAQALGLQLSPARAGAQAFQGRVQSLQGVLLSEEVYGSRLHLNWTDPAARGALLLVQHGRCIVECTEPGAPMLMLKASGHNAALLTNVGSQQLTITQAPCRLVRLLLPPGTSHLQRGLWAVELDLLLPMLRLLEQSLQRKAPERTRLELGVTLLGYIWERLASAGCTLQLPRGSGSSEDPLGPLQVWINAHLGESLELADLAAAVNLSPRRLQELCRSRHGCSPMELLREQRLKLLAQQLRDPEQAGRSLTALMAALQLSDSASTRQAFERSYGCSPAVYRRGAPAGQPA